MIKKVDQSKWKYCRDKWRKNNPEYDKDYYKKVILTNPEKIEEKRQAAKIWQIENREKAYENNKKWRDKNREKLNLKAKEYRENNREKYLETRKKSNDIIRNNPLSRFKENIRSLISSSFKRGGKNFKKRKHTEEILGCTIEEFIDHILSKCPHGIGIEHFGKNKLNIDHIIPISSATSEEEVLKLNHYTNLQPLHYLDNLSKSNKIL